MPPDDEDWLDADTSPLVRPYAAVGGRTKPAHRLDMITMIVATGDPPPAGTGPHHVQALAACAHPSSVAEISASLRLPAVVTKIIISDLMDSGAVRTRDPGTFAGAQPDRSLLQAVLNGLQSL
ncbi:MAG: DUF742 domain-containing protein [Trebonia sp.]